MSQSNHSNGPLRRWSTRLAVWAAKLVLLYAALAYIVLPMLWKHHEHHRVLSDAPKTTVTAQGIPGDPLNVGVVGTQEQVVRALLEAGWRPADPITLRSSIGIAKSVLLDRPYEDAPVSNLFVFGRKQDLAFEKDDGKSAKRRHHVRFWKAEQYDYEGRPLWLGSDTFDQSVGVSHRTGQITHHVAPDIDAERNALVADLEKAGWAMKIFQVTGVGATIQGRNGGGDWYYTDGEMSIVVLSKVGPASTPSIQLASPPVVQIKDQLWTVLRTALSQTPLTD